jgi:hypothetical protein
VPRSAPSSTPCGPNSCGEREPSARRSAISRRTRSAAPTASGLGAGTLALFGAASLGLLLTLYRPALDAPFVSDDFHYVASNAYVHEFSLENFLVLLDPSGPATIAVVNWAPAQLVVHNLAWQVFGERTRPHRLINLSLHVLASTWLAALLFASGLPRAAALLGGLLFLVHPANVEAVVWISQLKTTLAMALSLAALLAWRRHPGLSTALFGLALLAKATAAFALPVAALFDWTRGERVRWRWLAAWAALLAGYAMAEFATHQRSGAAEATLYETPFVLLRTVAALWLRYLVMAASAVGLSAFHEPAPARSLLDPWWLGSLPASALIAWRALLALRRRHVELAYWVWAVVSFAPVSQVFPFLYPLADRYLYFILPGLLGGALFLAQEGLARAAAASGRPPARFARGALALGLALAALFAWRCVDRASIWRSSGTLYADAALHYPDGKAAHVLRARRAGLAGDARAAAAALRRAGELGYYRFEQVEADPAYAAVRDQPEFRAVVRELAGRWIERVGESPSPTQHELRMLAHAFVARGEIERALALLERAEATGGPYTDAVRAELAAVRAALAGGSGAGLRLAPPDS